MERIIVNHYELSDEQLDRVADSLRAGEVVIFPTDTLYGLAADAFNVSAIEHLKRIKKRTSNNPISVVVRDLKMVKEIAYVSPLTEQLMNALFPGEVTIVLNKRRVISEELTAGLQCVGVRIPDNPITRQLSAAFDRPYTATSANISGEENIFDSEKIMKQFSKTEQKLRLFIDAGDLLPKKPSTVIRVCEDQLELIREGAIHFSDIKKTFETIKVEL